MRGQPKEDEEKPLLPPSPPAAAASLPRRSREGILGKCSSLHDSEAMRHLVLPDFLKAPDADSVPSLFGRAS